MEQKRIAIPIRPYWNLLANYLKPQKAHATILGLLLLSSIGLQLANLQIVRYFLDKAETESGLDKLFGAAALFMGVTITHHVIRVAITYVGENVAWEATNMLRADLVLHCLKLDMSFHKKHKPGELIERIDGDVNQLANFFSQLVVQLGGNLLLEIGILALLTLLDWRIGLSVAASAVLGVLTLDWLNKRTVPRWQTLREADARLFGFLEERLNGTEEIRSCGAEPYVMRRLYQALRWRWQKIMAATRIQVLSAALPLNTFALAYAAAHILGNTFLRQGQMSIGEVYLVFYYLDTMKRPLWEILRQVKDLQRAVASINRVAELRQMQSTIRDGAGVAFPDGPLAVTFDDVSFYYQDDVETNVLQQITFSLRPGTVLGLLGRTGSGKSTLTKLLFRFYDPSAGTIRLGSADPLGNGAGQMFDIRQARQSQLRQYIGLVPQEVQLFAATVRQNLTLFDDSVSDERVLQAINQVGLGDWLLGLPDGLGTLLEACGSGLSAGEAQLLALARVFLSDPGLVILDEASSRLDPLTERRIEKALDRLLANRTAIIIAHRLGTVHRAHEIMILQDGSILEHAPRSDLAGDPDSRFYTLLHTGLQDVMA